MRRLVRMSSPVREGKTATSVGFHLEQKTRGGWAWVWVGKAILNCKKVHGSVRFKT